ncbi:YraN family protein [Paenibacillus abyssi]|uniref:UPF0102 protein GCM10010916_31780 n=1 Tax=Paenibacillus abyssi TaxID=1340531 RepID=A0A917D4N0_9BACL|nr:YraN family protein [Paenibacillus abyssi]GGG12512.1 UPF0102 protein [Paenibacillus abyssi]
MNKENDRKYADANQPAAGISRANRQAIGQLGEAAGAEYLLSLGWTLVERNWRCRSGEIDLIGHPPGENNRLVFIEVRTRRSGGRYGTPAESVDYRKQARVRSIAQFYMNYYRVAERKVRFDVIAVTLDARLNITDLKHIEGAF